MIDAGRFQRRVVVGIDVEGIEPQWSGMTIYHVQKHRLNAATGQRNAKELTALLRGKHRYGDLRQ